MPTVDEPGHERCCFADGIDRQRIGLRRRFADYQPDGLELIELTLSSGALRTKEVEVAKSLRNPLDRPERDTQFLAEARVVFSRDIIVRQIIIVDIASADRFGLQILQVALGIDQPVAPAAIEIVS